MTDVELYFDTKLRPKMAECLKHPEIDETSKYYIGQALWYIEHDLADGRNPALRIDPVAKTLIDEEFYRNVYEGRYPGVEKLLRELGELAKEFLNECLRR